MLNATLNMLLTIVDRGKGDGVAQLLQREGVMAHFIALGNGTADQGLLSLLGLKDTAKDVVFSFMRRDTAVKALRKLSYALDIDLPGRGIAFLLPLSSVGGSQTRTIFPAKTRRTPDRRRAEPCIPSRTTRPATI